ncbi:hypothetical protein SAMD00019534_045810, partial [Acytostelium subglobosum LB1]|uniref:hypothetical protein n=1 Tax=Acytostelium subglobosum LB1 TaxID=1410327 RepID=UPI000644C71A
LYRNIYRMRIKDQFLNTFQQVSPNNMAVISLAMWFVMNISTLILNKYIYVSLHFTYPVSLTAIHMMVCSIGSYLVLRVFEMTPLVPISMREQLKTILPLGALFAFNIVLGNVSLRWVPVSFMQTVKSSVPLFTVAMQTMFFGKRFCRNTYLSMIPIVGGVCLASLTEVNYNHYGFYAALLASIVSALFAIVSGMSLSTQLNAINLLYYMAPCSFLLLTPLALIYELPTIQEKWDKYGEVGPVVMLLISGAIAFMLNVFTFLVIRYTSPLTYTVSGNLKVVLSITISVIIFQNEVNFMNGIGCAVAIAGVIWYSKIRFEAQNQPKEDNK